MIGEEAIAIKPISPVGTTQFAAHRFNGGKAMTPTYLVVP